MLVSIIQTLGNIGVFAIAALIIKAIIDKSANKQIESYKSELEKDLSKFQHKLELELIEHKENLERLTFKYSKFHENRIGILSEFYSKLSDLHIYMIELTAMFKVVKENYKQEELERLDTTKNAYNEFMFYFERNRIYFNEKTCLLFSEIRDKYYENLTKYNFSQNFSEDAVFSYKILKEIQDSMQNKIPTIRKELENEIREMISIDK